MVGTTMEDWDEVADWLDSNLQIPVSYMIEANSRKYPVDAFSLGQLASKAWLLKKLYPIATHPIKDWVIIGSWIGSLVPLLHQRFIINRVYGIDHDHRATILSEVFNRRYVQDDWKFKAVDADIRYLETKWLQFQTGNELIQVKPGVVINTSCEHMGTEWFDTADSDQLIVMQTNNSDRFDGHINICSSVKEMQEKYNMQKVLYAGEFKMPAYTRYMQIGYR
jgi:hypothetical protein